MQLLTCSIHDHAYWLNKKNQAWDLASLAHVQGAICSLNNSKATSKVAVVNDFGWNMWKGLKSVFRDNCRFSFSTILGYSSILRDFSFRSFRPVVANGLAWSASFRTLRKAQLHGLFGPEQKSCAYRACAVLSQMFAVRWKRGRETVQSSSQSSGLCWKRHEEFIIIIIIIYFIIITAIFGRVLAISELIFPSSGWLRYLIDHGLNDFAQSLIRELVQVSDLRYSWFHLVSCLTRIEKYKLVVWPMLL